MSISLRIELQQLVQIPCDYTPAQIWGNIKAFTLTILL